MDFIGSHFPTHVFARWKRFKPPNSFWSRSIANWLVATLPIKRQYNEFSITLFSASVMHARMILHTLTTSLDLRFSSLYLRLSPFFFFFFCFSTFFTSLRFRQHFEQRLLSSVHCEINRWIKIKIVWKTQLPFSVDSALFYSLSLSLLLYHSLCVCKCMDVCLFRREFIIRLINVIIERLKYHLGLSLYTREQHFCIQSTTNMKNAS